jgi:hypothetical protein
MYKSWDHLKFSLYGYVSPTRESLKKTNEQAWWGLEIPFTPDEKI